MKLTLLAFFHLVNTDNSQGLSSILKNLISFVTYKWTVRK